MSVWDRELKCVEAATSVIEPWQEREQLINDIEDAEKQTLLPEEAPGQLVQIDAMIEERQAKLEEVKSKRRAIRDKAEQIPVSRRMFDLQGRIEAASEQATWIEALEEQIERLDGQIDRARSQLRADADRYGMDEADRDELIDGDTNQLPDLSRSTLATLSTPAKAVKEQSFLLKQARSEGAEQKSKLDRLSEPLEEVLGRAREDNLQEAIRHVNESVITLRQRNQVDDHLEKLRRHYRSLEQESVDLTTEEAYPVDSVLVLLLPIVFGATALVYGLSHIMRVTWFTSGPPDPMWGMMFVCIGLSLLVVCSMLRKSGHRSTLLDMEDCERQIDTLRRQIREAEIEADDLDAELPGSNQPLESRIRESEQLLLDLESQLPTYHAHQAAFHAYKDSRARARQAADGLREAKRQWASTLDRLGLGQSMSPSAVRALSDGYEALLASRRRLDELQEEQEQRKRERQSIAKRIETLYLESLESDSDTETDSDEDLSNSVRPRLRQNPLEQLSHLHEELARQQHWIKRRRELKQQDHTLKRSQASHHRAIERGEQQRRALWAKCGVATAEQFYELVDLRAALLEMRSQKEALDSRIRSMIGSHVDYDQVANEVDGATSTELERRWDSLTTRMSETEERIAQLRTAQGELLAEMKHLGDDNRLSTVQLELGCIERQIGKAANQWQTLALTSDMMEEVCRTVERERQPETLREASSFLNQLTDGKYSRIWTPLGTNKLMIDGEENSLPLDVLSRGTREAVFIALRLSLTAAYARRGVMLPLVLDDVLVNFDGERAEHAAQTLKTFSELGHQVMMFTCHEHIVDIFHEIDVEVRLLPAQGEPARVEILEPEYEEEPAEEEEYEEEAVDEIEEEVEAVAEEEEEEVIPDPEPRA